MVVLEESTAIINNYTNTSSDTVAAILKAGMDSNCDWTVDDTIICLEPFSMTPPSGANLYSK